MRTRLHAPLALAGLLALVSAIPASAQPNNTPVGRWRITFYNDNTPGMTQMATQGLCILPNNTWYGTFPNWRGRWFQKGVNPAGIGDRFRLLGNYAGGAGNDAAELEFVNLGTMAGTWTEWRDFSNPFFVWTRAILTRVAPNCPPMPPVAPPPPNARESERNPMDPGQPVPRELEQSGAERVELPTPGQP
jgi:hypothetical protein